MVLFEFGKNKLPRTMPGLGWVALAERTESLGPAVPPSFKAWIFPFHSLRFPLLATWPPPPKGEKAGS